MQENIFMINIFKLWLQVYQILSLLFSLTKGSIFSTSFIYGFDI